MDFKKLEYTPVGDLVLVKPGPIRLMEAVYPVPDETKSKGKKKDETVELKDEVTQVRTALRIGTILKVSPFAQNMNIKVGDIIVYQDGRGRIFDLLQDKDTLETRDYCPVLLQRYDILSIVDNKESVNEEGKESSN